MSKHQAATEQYIFRREQRRNYTVIDNAMFDTSKLSLGAIGLACLILSKRDDWQVKIDYFASVCKEGEKAIRALLKELATAGYMMRVRERSSDGTLRTVTLIADYPRYIDIGTPEQRINGCDARTVTDLPSDGMAVDGMAVKGSAVRRHGGERDGGRGEVLISTDQVSTDQVSTDIDAPAAHTPQQEMFGAICEAIGWDYHVISDKNRGQVAQAIKVLVKAGYTVDDIRRFMVEVWFNDWRWEKKQQYPTLAQLREEIGKIRSIVPDVAPKKQTGMDAYREMLARQGITI